MEFCVKDRVGLLLEVIRVLRENGLTVIRVGVSIVGEKVKNVFYVRDALGNLVDMKIIEGLRKEIGRIMMFNVKKVLGSIKVVVYEISGWVKISFFFGSFLEKFLF